MVDVARFRIGFLLALSLCTVGSASFAQSSRETILAEPSFGQSPKTPVKKSLHKNRSPALSAAKPTSEEDEKAARLAEGRKKFFERSMGFDNGSSSGSAVTLSTGNGLSPGAAFKF
jgi:hypothetical protein